ncbi:MAG TPA: FadR/GntR family transcriptional regulator [Acidimicrobiia bacterium]|jgi:GntR family transcriptional repressor for pyruvate dehydrogenase complex
MSAPLTEAAIRQIREMIATGTLAPGDKLSPEAELAGELGASRNTVREAVRGLVTAGVLDVRRGDGTYVTSLRPEQLLDGIGAAAELMAEGFSLELIQVRRILEPAATALAALRIDDETLGELARLLGRMRSAENQEVLVQADSDFHAVVAAASGNSTLASMLGGVSTRTMRSRIWRGVIEENAKEQTIAQHDEILRALQDHDPTLGEAAALVHVATTEASLRRMIDSSAT